MNKQTESIQSKIRNLLSPINNLISLIDNEIIESGIIYDSIDDKIIEIIKMEIKNSRDSISKLSNLEVINNEIDASYLLGVFNTGGIDALHKETSRLLTLNIKPHQILETNHESNKL